MSKLHAFERMKKIQEFCPPLPIYLVWLKDKAKNDNSFFEICMIMVKNCAMCSCSMKFLMNKRFNNFQLLIFV